jgi:hypothetical protein
VPACSAAVGAARQRDINHGLANERVALPLRRIEAAAPVLRSELSEPPLIPANAGTQIVWR